MEVCACLGYNESLKLPERNRKNESLHISFTE